MSSAFPPLGAESLAPSRSPKNPPNTDPIDPLHARFAERENPQPDSQTTPERPNQHRPGIRARRESMEAQPRSPPSLLGCKRPTNRRIAAIAHLPNRLATDRVPLLSADSAQTRIHEACNVHRLHDLHGPGTPSLSPTVRHPGHRAAAYEDTQTSPRAHRATRGHAPRRTATPSSVQAAPWKPHRTKRDTSTDVARRGQLKPGCGAQTSRHARGPEGQGQGAATQGPQIAQGPRAPAGILRIALRRLGWEAGTRQAPRPGTGCRCVSIGVSVRIGVSGDRADWLSDERGCAARCASIALMADDIVVIRGRVNV
ncbi:hypothetical protein WOLCODRAFT_145962 [Wolfiporia cocos MD-104 SS10]|uniref:Uncharacterized protein n=1 Tax=Wolfiporia cocos (strain MD-104) TaxID=742152 RepID=A0A2H3JIH1_WOLCO|nr:hypothetical protein WOLCODRAFT_145962 [Wolfiporia cocos MD-104 SS10]